MHRYEKRFTDDLGSYVIFQVRDDGIERQVDRNHNGYLNYIADGNIETIVPYVPPPEPTSPPKSEFDILKETVDQLVLDSLGV